MYLKTLFFSCSHKWLNIDTMGMPEALLNGERRYGSDPLFFKCLDPNNEVSDFKIEVSEPKHWELFSFSFAFKYMSVLKVKVACSEGLHQTCPSWTVARLIAQLHLAQAFSFDRQAGSANWFEGFAMPLTQFLRSGEQFFGSEAFSRVRDPSKWLRLIK